MLFVHETKGAPSGYQDWGCKDTSLLRNHCQITQGIFFPQFYGTNVSPQFHRLKSKVPRVIVLEGAFGRCLGNEGGAFMFGMNALIKEAPERSLAPSTL